MNQRENKADINEEPQREKRKTLIKNQRGKKTDMNEGEKRMELKGWGRSLTNSQTHSI